MALAVNTIEGSKGVFSVDLMFAFDNIFPNALPLKKLKLNSDVIKSNLNSKPWITQDNIRYGPSDVIKNPGKYPDDEERIKKANLDYPIYIDYNGDVLDGYHRLTKAAIQKKPTVNVKVFTKDLLDKFLISKTYKDVRKWKLHNYIEKFEKEFCVDNTE